MARGLVVILAMLALPGCTILQLSVSNPVPALSRVAIVPFFNLSAERAVDGRRFAEAYFAELQKVRGFEVLPVGVAEQAAYDHKLAMDTPDDALKLAHLLDVDVVVVGAVTDYSPYYPPRIGMKVAWYSPHPWRFLQGLWTHPTQPWSPAPSEWVDADEGRLHRLWRYLKSERRFYRRLPQKAQDVVTIRGQSDRLPAAGVAPPPLPAETAPAPAPLLPPSPAPTPVPGLLPPLPAPSVEPPPHSHDARQPIMSYARMFDGADAHLVATLRDYVALSGDLRSGGWEAYLQRSDDFIRFASHLMIYEMLALHGGEVSREHRLRK